MYTIQFDNPCHVHFIGIGGISMSGLAEVLLNRGFTVSGSDMQASNTTKHLEKIGANVIIGQKAENITDDIKLVVFTAAISETNEEYMAAKNAGIPMITRATLLGQIMEHYKNSVAVAGTHGKTTTTSMLTHIFLQGNTDPTVSVGGILDRIDGNIRIGHSELFLTEACEYTNSFLELRPKFSIILNVEEDHMDFFKDIEDIKHSFHQFAAQTTADGVVIINGDMEHTKDIVAGLSQKVVTFGLKEGNAYSATDIEYDHNGNSKFTLLIHGEPSGTFHLNVKGEHNVMNALSTIICARELGLPMDVIAEGIFSFGGTKRRFEYKGSIGEVKVVDDYAHHPTEITATLKAARELEHDDLWVVFQPHTYTRTIAFLDGFAEALSHADHIVLADIYAAREIDEGKVSSMDIVTRLEKMGKDVHYFPSFGEIEAFLLENIKGHDLLMTVGAGNVVQIGEDLVNNK